MKEGAGFVVIGVMVFLLGTYMFLFSKLIGGIHMGAGILSFIIAWSLEVPIPGGQSK